MAQLVWLVTLLWLAMYAVVESTISPQTCPTVDGAVCVMNTQGQVKCFGNGPGLGHPVGSITLATINEYDPIDFHGEVPQEILCHHSMVCATTDQRNMWCWGRGYSMAEVVLPSQELPSIMMDSCCPEAMRNTTEHDVHHICQEYMTMCAIYGNHELGCWGYNYYGAQPYPREPVSLSGPAINLSAIGYGKCLLVAPDEESMTKDYYRYGEVVQETNFYVECFAAGFYGIGKKPLLDPDGTEVAPKQFGYGVVLGHDSRIYTYTGTSSKLYSHEDEFYEVDPPVEVATNKDTTAVVAAICESGRVRVWENSTYSFYIDWQDPASEDFHNIIHISRRGWCILAINRLMHVQVWCKDAANSWYTSLFPEATGNYYVIPDDYIDAGNGCPAGQFYDGEQCSPCEPGTTSLFNSAGCGDCPAGTYANAGIDCLQCASGSYSLARSSACTLCPIAKYSGAVESTACTNCTAGYTTYVPGKSSCDECGVGYFSESGGLCVYCERGKYGVVPAATTCLECEPGQAKMSPTHCEDCEAGEFLIDDTCDPCPPGSYSVAPRSTACELCAPGKYQSNMLSTECLDCEEGLRSGTGALSCQACDIGMEPSETEGCVACPLGKFGGDGNTCKPCLSGTYGAQEGQSTCTTCPVGRSGVGLEESEGHKTLDSGCNPCPMGSFGASRNEGERYCEKCPHGRYSVATGSSECNMCVAGYFQEDAGATSCLPCPPSFVTASSGASSCFACEPGTSAPQLGMVVCTDCTPGSFRFDGMSCEDCNAGLFSNTTKATSCHSCLEGSHAPDAKATACLTCQPGRFIESSGSSSCRPCGRGSWLGVSGGTACLQAGRGTFVAEEASSTPPVPCSEGTYQPNAGSSYCMTCGSDSHTTLSVGASSKSECGCKVGKLLDGEACISCPENSECLRFNQTGIVAKPGFWVDASSPAMSVIQCSPPAACTSSGCSVGYEGDACSACERAFYRFQGSCIPCPSDSKSSMMIFAFLLATQIFVLVPWFIAGKMSKPKGAAGPGVSSGSDTLTKVGEMSQTVLMALQTTSIFASLDVVWPQTLKDLLDSMSLTNFNFEVVHPECSVDVSLRIKVACVVALPLFATTVYLCMSLIYKQCMPARYNPAQWKHSAIIFYSLCFVGISRQSWGMFRCKNNGSYFTLESEPSVICFEDEWKSVFPAAAFGMIMTIAFVATLWVAMFKHRRNFSLMFESDHWLYPVVKTYECKANAFWWEALQLSKRLILIVISCLANTPSIEIFLSFFVLFVSLLAHTFLHPYLFRDSDRLEFTSLVFMCTILYIASVLYGRDKRSSLPEAESEFFATVGLFAFVMFLSQYAIQIIRSSLKSSRAVVSALAKERQFLDTFEAEKKSLKDDGVRIRKVDPDKLYSDVQKEQIPKKSWPAFIRTTLTH